MNNNKYNRLKSLRLERELSQASLSSYLGIAQNTYSVYETGKVDLTAKLLVKLADFYGVSVDYLLNVTDERDQAARE